MNCTVTIYFKNHTLNIKQLEDRRNVGENSRNSGDGTDQTGPILDVYDDDDDDDDIKYNPLPR